MFEFFLALIILSSILTITYLYFRISSTEKVKFKKNNFKLTPCFKLHYNNGIIVIRLFLGGECIAHKSINSQVQDIEGEILKVKDELMEKLYRLYEDHKLINYLINKHSTIVETSFTVEK